MLQSAYQSHKTQLSIAPLGAYYAALNTQVPPFNNINLRKAVIAMANRNAYLLARGGKLVGQVATHFIYPEVPGFSRPAATRDSARTTCRTRTAIRPSPAST